jgi:hypothetical protein
MIGSSAKEKLLIKAGRVACSYSALLNGLLVACIKSRRREGPAKRCSAGLRFLLVFLALFPDAFSRL